MGPLSVQGARQAVDGRAVPFYKRVLLVKDATAVHAIAASDSEPSDLLLLRNLVSAVRVSPA